LAALELSSRRRFAEGSIQILIILSIFGISFLIIFFFTPSTNAVPTTTYALSINSSFGTTFGSGSYSNGSEVSFGLSPTIVYSSGGSTRYIFSGWSCSGNGCYSGTNPSAFVVMNYDIVETARWETQYLLSTTTTGNGSTNPLGQNWYNAESTVQVSETPAEERGWIFAYWELDGQNNVGSSQTYTVTMNSPHALIANFVEPEIMSNLVNVTDSNGNVLRNPDGTFYRLDKIEIHYDVTIVSGNPTISQGVTIDVSNLTYPHNVLSEVASGSEYTIFIVLPNAPFAPYNITLVASIMNSVGNSKRPIPSYGYVPFAVVDYSPHFTYFTYLDYNALNSSSYERAFVVLLRYNGNSPGYSYSGDINTSPFNAMNSTGERAIVNGFTFSTDGWSISSNLGIMNDSLSVMNFVEHPNLVLSVALEKNNNPAVITWPNRVQKYYFLSNMEQINNYVDTNSIMYFNVTTSAWYTNTYSSKTFRTSDFNASYLYEPIFYNGYLVFKPFGGSSRAMDFSVSIVSHNPDPLDSYLISEASSIFGSDTTVIGSLERDLYPAYSTTILKPVISNSQEWVFLINQTNMATANSDGMPYFTISVSGNAGYTEYYYEPNNPPYYLSSSITSSKGFENTTFNVYDYFGLFAMSDFPSSIPFKVLTGYYFIQAAVGEDFVMEPLNFSFSPSSSMPYLVRTYADPSGPFFVSSEPGNLTQSYPMIYGENSSTIVSPSLGGGGITGLAGGPIPLNGGTSYEVSLLISNESGGASYAWVVSDKGQVLYNESLLPSSSSSSSLAGSFGMAGYVGEYTFQFPVGNTNSSVTIDIENSWGALNVISGVEITPHSPPSLVYSPLFLATILLLAFAISSGYIVFGRKHQSNS
jgi:hypothetical protein